MHGYKCTPKLRSSVRLGISARLSTISSAVQYRKAYYILHLTKTNSVKYPISISRKTTLKNTPLYPSHMIYLNHFRDSLRHRNTLPTVRLLSTTTKILLQKGGFCFSSLLTQNILLQISSAGAVSSSYPLFFDKQGDAETTWEVSDQGER